MNKQPPFFTSYLKNDDKFAKKAEMVLKEFYTNMYMRSPQEEYLQKGLSTPNMVFITKSLHQNYGDMFPHFNVSIDGIVFHIFVYLGPRNKPYYYYST